MTSVDLRMILCLCGSRPSTVDGPGERTVADAYPRGGPMHRTRWMLGAVVALAAAAAVAIALAELRQKWRQADAAVNDIETQLDALDPVTRAVVMARVGADAARRRD